MMNGKMKVEVWDSIIWVTVKHTKVEHKYQVLPDEGRTFEVVAHNEDDLKGEIEKNLRRQLPDFGEKYNFESDQRKGYDYK